MDVDHSTSRQYADRAALSAPRSACPRKLCVAAAVLAWVGCTAIGLKYGLAAIPNAVLHLAGVSWLLGSLFVVLRSARTQCRQWWAARGATTGLNTPDLRAEPSYRSPLSSPLANGIAILVIAFMFLLTWPLFAVIGLYLWFLISGLVLGH